MQWDWKSKGLELESARRTCDADDRPGHVEDALERFRLAVAAAWPPDFFKQLARCKRGNPAGLDDVLDFVEACPYFFRSGYILGMALRYISRPPRNTTQTERIQAIVIAGIGRRLRLPFRRLPSLALAVDSPGLRARLSLLTESPDELVRAGATETLRRLTQRRSA
jgi:hypothetical protein